MVSLGIVDTGVSIDHQLVKAFQDEIGEAEVKTQAPLSDFTTEEILKLSDIEAEFPIYTELGSGEVAYIPSRILTPYIQNAIDDLVERGASLITVICGGSFPKLTTPVPLILPGALTAKLVSSVIKPKRLGVLVPSKGQVKTIQRKWKSFGFDPVMVAIPPVLRETDPTTWRCAVDRFSKTERDVVVADCMGFGDLHAKDLRENARVLPVMAKELTISTCSSILNAKSATEKQIPRAYSSCASSNLKG